ncbi:hypothetical protein NQ317_001720 [Molorchus minor]|uniref:Uncharacterized protein n=1 Tax=Molorchus minor TaxID=1323400 RepID=A0ABQ9IY06_9CUCU|nr:hypothetical protein NQ317_001720 [Molorchus minor]
MSKWHKIKIELSESNYSPTDTVHSFHLHFDGVMTKRRKRHSQHFTGEMDMDVLFSSSSSEDDEIDNITLFCHLHYSHPIKRRCTLCSSGTATLDEKNVMRTPTLVEKNAICSYTLYTFRTSAEYADEKN